MGRVIASKFPVIPAQAKIQERHLDPILATEADGFPPELE
jgi:hypothetical protein